jgi:hypothetical protein
MMATHVPECYDRAEARRAELEATRLAEAEAGRQAKLVRMKAAGVEWAAEHLEKTRAACREHHDACACLGDAVKWLRLEVAALRDLAKKAEEA